MMITQHTEKLLKEMQSFGLLEPVSEIEPQVVSSFKDVAGISSDKPKMLLFSSYEFGLDFISQNAELLSEYFDIHKVFTNAIIHSDDDKHYKQIISIGRDFKSFGKVLSECSFDYIVISNLGIYYHWYVPFFKHYSDAKIICIEKDFSSFILKDDPEIMDNSIEGGTERLDFESECEHFMLEHSDGIITNLHNSFVNDQIPELIEKVFFYMPVRSRKVMHFQETQLNYNIATGFCGSLIPPSTATKYAQEGVLYSVFKKLLEDDFIIDAYVLGDYEALKAEYDLGDNFKFYRPIMADEIIKAISSKNFGHMLYNFGNVTEKQLEVYQYHFPTKMFTMLAAGLPLLISAEYGAAKDFVLNTGVGIPVKFDELQNIREIISGYDFNELKSNVYKFQQEYSLEAKCGELLDFLLKI